MSHAGMAPREDDAVPFLLYPHPVKDALIPHPHCPDQEAKAEWVLGDSVRGQGRVRI